MKVFFEAIDRRLRIRSGREGSVEAHRLESLFHFGELVLADDDVAADVEQDALQAGFVTLFSQAAAVQFALALRLTRREADGLLQAAGYALSPAIPEDAVFAFCLGNGISDLFKVNDMLYENGLKTIPTK